MTTIATSISLPEFNSIRLGTKSKFKPKLLLETKPDPEENLELQPLIHEPRIGPTPDFKPEIESETDFKPETKSGADYKPETKPELKSEFKTYLRPKSKPEPDIEAIRSVIQAECKTEPVPNWSTNGHRSKPRYEPKRDIVVNQATQGGLIQSTSFCPDCPTCMGVTLGYHQQGGPMGLSYAFLWNIRVQTAYNLKPVDLICPNCMQHVRTRIEKRTLAGVWLLGMILLGFW